MDVRHPMVATAAAAAASTTPSSSGTIRESAPRSWAPGSSATPDGRRTREWKGAWGPNPPVPHTGLRPHSSHAPVDRDGGRHDVPLPRRVTRRGARRRPARPRTARTSASAAAPPSSANSSPPGSSTTCTSWSSRSCSAEVYASGGAWRASKGLPGRGDLRAERRHARDVHPHGHLNRPSRGQGAGPAVLV